MAISMDSTYLTHQNILTNSSGVSTDKLSSSLGNIKSETPDDELLEACKGFEQYFVEQVLKEFTNSLEEFKDNKYMEMFGDTLVETMATKRLGSTISVGDCY